MPLRSLIDKVRKRLSPDDTGAVPTPGLVDRIKQRLLGGDNYDFLPQAQPQATPDPAAASTPTDPTALPSGPPPRAVMEMMIHQAGRSLTLLLCKHNGVWRHIEPYSFRTQRDSKTGAYKEPLFYAYCRLHDEIHSFYLSRFEGLTMTDEPFSPRWPVEVA